MPTGGRGPRDGEELRGAHHSLPPRARGRRQDRRLLRTGRCCDEGEDAGAGRRAAEARIAILGIVAVYATPVNSATAYFVTSSPVSSHAIGGIKYRVTEFLRAHFAFFC